jgi:E3 ubiquitin-protein ligase RNF115/126
LEILKHFFELSNVVYGRRMEQGDPELLEALARSLDDYKAKGPPATSQLALRELVEDIVISKRHLPSSCSVCGDEFSQDDDAKKLPCKHIFHDLCILTWLKMVFLNSKNFLT